MATKIFGNFVLFEIEDTFRAEFMELIKALVEILIHLDTHLDLVIRSYGVWTYGILFLIIFLETGLVVTPFLPGDSLLFAGGTFAALGSLDAKWLVVFLSIAAIAGDTVNYWIGHAVGPKVFTKEKSRLLNKEYLYRTHRFYEKYGERRLSLPDSFPLYGLLHPSSPASEA